MPFALRKIKKQRWFPNEPSWLKNNDFVADPLADLNTSQGSLSVWKIEDDQSNLAMIIAALASTLEHPSHLDYALLDIQEILNASFKLEPRRGDTKYPEADRYHLDIIELSASKLVALCHLMLQKAAKDRFSKPKVKQLLIDAVKQGKIQPLQLSKDLQDWIKEEGP